MVVLATPIQISVFLCPVQEGGELLLGLQSGIFSFNTATGAARKLADFEPGLDTRPNDGRRQRC